MKDTVTLPVIKANIAVSRVCAALSQLFDNHYKFLLENSLVGSVEPSPYVFLYTDAADALGELSSVLRALASDNQMALQYSVSPVMAKAELLNRKVYSTYQANGGGNGGGNGEGSG